LSERSVDVLITDVKKIQKGIYEMDRYSVIYNTVQLEELAAVGMAVLVRKWIKN
jgi:hypothetical protein